MGLITRALVPAPRTGRAQPPRLKRRNWAWPLLAVALIISASACASGNVGSTGNSGTSGTPPPTTNAVAASGPGDYQFAYKGATGVVSILADPQDPAVAKLEAYRKKAGAPPVTYFVAHVDNTNGTGNINMYQVVVVTADGQQVQAMGVESTVGTWQKTFGTADTKSYNEGVNLINANQFLLRPGAKGAAVLVSTQAVPSVRRVFVYPAGGFDQIEMTKVNG